MTKRSLLVPLLATLLGGCFLPPRAPEAVFSTAEIAPPPNVEIREKISRPTVTRIAREGDPSPALALAVLTEGGEQAAIALATIVESRLEQAGLGPVMVEADQDGYRLRALVPGPREAAMLVDALRAALLAQLVPGSKELARATERLELHHRRLALLPKSASIASCGDRAAESRLDPSTPQGFAALEGARRASHVASRLSLGAVGPRAIGDAALAAVDRGGAWPDGPLPRESWPAEDESEVTLRDSGALRVHLALRVGDAGAAMIAAERAGDPASVLAARLSALSSPFRLVEVVATARARGGCLTAIIEADKPLAEAMAETHAARAAWVLRQELSEELREVARRPVASPFQRALDATDPREAAALSAWWSLAARGTDLNRPARASIVAEIPSASAASTDASLRTKRLADALASTERHPEARVVEPVVRVERGQNRLWLLVASPCGLGSESSADAGITALSLLQATAGGDARDGVALEPWISTDGVGLLAHAERRPGESPRDLAGRVAREAARALAGSARDSSRFSEARGILLARLADSRNDEGLAFEAAAEALSPSHPSWIAPFGTWPSVTKLGPEAAALRREALRAGPLRVAVLADSSLDQGDVVARTLDRWLARTPEAPRTCPTSSLRQEPRSGMIQLELAPGATSSRALLAWPTHASATEHRSAMLLTAALEGPEGWLAQALRSIPKASAKARLVGGQRASALVVDLRAPEDALDDAVAQLRALAKRLAEGALAATDLERAEAALKNAELESSLDPRRRIVDLFAGRESSAASTPSLDAWRAFTKSTLAEEKAVLVVARPKK